MHIKHALPALALSAAAFSAQAVNTSWAAHDPVEVGAGFALGEGVLLQDTYSFTLATASTVTFTSVTNDYGYLNLSGSSLNLFSGPVGGGAVLLSQSFDSLQTQSSAVLAAGTYYYQVDAVVAAGAYAGSYTLTSTVSAVPEPQTLALMLAGLMVTGTLLSRRGQRD